MQGQGDEAFGAQYLQQVAALLAGVAEGQGADRAVVLQQQRDGGQPLIVADFVEALADLAAVVLFEQGDVLRLAQEIPRQCGNAFGIGGGEEQGLALFRAGPGDDGDVVEEAHVEHAIGFVQHQRVERGEVEAGALQVIHDAPRRADHDMGAVFQAGDLRPHGAAAAQRQHLDVVGATRQAADFLAHLVGQFARRAEHQRLHRKAARIQPGQQAQRKRGRLAAAGLGLGDQVVAGQRQRQAGGLDRRHLQVAELFQVRQGGGRQRQLVERRASMRWCPSACTDGGEVLELLESLRSCAIIKALNPGAQISWCLVDAQQHDAVVVGVDDPDMGGAGKHGLGFVEGIGRAAALAAAEHAEQFVGSIEQQDAVVVLVGQPDAIAVKGQILRTAQPDFLAEAAAMLERGIEHLDAVIGRIDDVHAAVTCGFDIVRVAQLAVVARPGRRPCVPACRRETR